MPKDEARAQIAALGGGIANRRNAIIGGAVGCGSIILGLLLACGLLFGWVGNTVKAAITAEDMPVQLAPDVLYQVAEDGSIVELGGDPAPLDPYYSRSDALEQCAVGETAIEIRRFGKLQGWACNKEMGQ